MAEAPKKTKSTTTTEKKKAAPKKSSAVEKKTIDTSSSEIVQSTQTFDNEFIKASVAFSPGCKVSIQVEILPPLVQESYSKALKEISKSISIPGFRKGKVPTEMIQKNYHSHIEEQSKQYFAQKALEQVLTLSKLRPLNQNQIKTKILDESKDNIQISFNFETYPVVPSIDLTKVNIGTVDIEEVTLDRVDEVIEVMRTYRAKWETVKDRPVQQEDFVEIDIENAETHAKIVSQKRVHLSKGKLSSWLVKLLTGMNQGESKEGMSKWDEEVMPASEKKDFTPTLCKVTVLAIFTAELPSVDEEFAKAMGTQSIADLRTQVMIRLKKNAEQIAHNKQREILDEQLQDLVDFEIPTSLIEAETKTKLEIKEQELKSANFSEEDLKTKQEELEKEAKEVAVKSLKLFFILQKIANDHNIIVGEQELRELIAERLAQLNIPNDIKSNPKFMNHFLPELRMTCFIDLLTDKVRRFLVKKIVNS